MRGSGSFVMFINIHVFYSLSAILRVSKIQIKNKKNIGMTTCDAKNVIEISSEFFQQFFSQTANLSYYLLGGGNNASNDASLQTLTFVCNSAPCCSNVVQLVGCWSTFKREQWLVNFLLEILISFKTKVGFFSFLGFLIIACCFFHLFLSGIQTCSYSSAPCCLDCNSS